MKTREKGMGIGPNVSRATFLRAGSAALAASLAAGLVAPKAWSAETPQANAGLAGPNGINPADYVGGDGSYQRYLKDGIRLGFEPNPGNLQDPAPGKRSGWNSDIVLEALRRVGITQYQFAPGPWETMVPGLQSSRFDLLMSDVHVTPARVQIIDFTTPVYWYGDILVVPKGNPAHLTDWASLAGKHIGVVRGYDLAEMLQKRTDLGDLVQYPDDISLATDTASGRLDGMIAGDANFIAMQAQNTGLALDIVPTYVSQTDATDWTRYGVRKGENDIGNVMSRALEEMFIDGTTLKILKDYGFGTRNLFTIKGAK